MFDRGRCLVLASGSPRRLELLRELTADFTVVVSGVPEPVEDSLTPAENMLAIARDKADAVAADNGDCLILAADTDVVLGGQILGKPVDNDDAVDMLRRLRGRPHEVLTAVVVVDAANKQRYEGVERSVVHVRYLTDQAIAAYVATGEPLDKAGGYAIQGEAATMVESVEGCYTNVVGLPLCAAHRLLSEAGLDLRSSFACPGHDQEVATHQTYA